MSLCLVCLLLLPSLFIEVCCLMMFVGWWRLLFAVVCCLVFLLFVVFLFVDRSLLRVV